LGDSAFLLGGLYNQGGEKRVEGEGTQASNGRKSGGSLIKGGGPDEVEISQIGEDFGGKGIIGKKQARASLPREGRGSCGFSGIQVK